MKKRWKKIVALAMMLTLLFSNTGWLAIPYVKAEPIEEAVSNVLVDDEWTEYLRKDVNNNNPKEIKPDLLIEPGEDGIALSYRKKEIQWDDTQYNVFLIKNGEKDLTNEEQYKDIVASIDWEVKDNSDGTITIQNLQVPTDDFAYYKMETDNYNVLFNTNRFPSKMVPEWIDDSDIKNSIAMDYDGKQLNLYTGYPINQNRVGIHEIVTTHKGDVYRDSYPLIYFRKQITEKVNDRDFVDLTDPKSLISTKLVPKFGKKEDIIYYDIIFSDEVGDYPTVAAVARIVKESSVEDNYNKELPDKIVDNNGRTYQVINLFYNDKEVDLDFVDDKMETAGQSDIKKEAIAYRKTDRIRFSLDESEENKTVEYAYVDLASVAENNIATLKDKPLQDLGITELLTVDVKEGSAEGGTPTSYSLAVPEKEGNYFFYIKITNEEDISQIYITNGFVIDETPPIIITTFYDSNNEKMECPTEEKNRKYLKYGPITMDVFVEEQFTCEIKFVVTATDKDGNIIRPGEKLYKVEEVESENKSQDTTSSYEKRYKLTFAEYANYTVFVKAKDFSGNEAITRTYYFTVDGASPTGTLRVNGFGKENEWSSLLNIIKYKLFNKKTATFELEGEDQLSTVACYYYIAEDIMKPLKPDELTEDDIDWEVYTKKVTIPADKREVVYGKIIDKAGNLTYISTDGLLTDTKAPIVTYMVDKEPNEEGFYKDDVSYKVKVEEISNIQGGSISGLKKVSYKILSDNKVTKEETVYENKSETVGTERKAFKIPVKASENNSNNVKVEIEAIDMAGNKVYEQIGLQIDNTQPEIKVTYDNNNIINGKYYNQKRTATITIKERNLDTKAVEISVRGKQETDVTGSKWAVPEMAEKSDDATYSCTFTFDKDDDYEVFVSCTDKAGNVAKNKWREEFTLDTTIPIIDVSYNGETEKASGYYKDVITATITIKEHNFDAGKADINITQADGTSVSASGFRNEGDKHTASVVFDQDGTYSLDVSFTDEAGNEAISYGGSIFHVDLKRPVIEISNIFDKSANAEDVKPVITCTDDNYNNNKVTILVKGVNTGDISLEKLGLVTKTLANGEEFSLVFPKEEGMDDIYTMSVKMEDKAGNTTEESLQFSVNRYGSVYTLASESGEWLKNGFCSYVQEGRNIVITETNVDEVVERNISYTLGGIDAETVEIKEQENCSSEEKSKGMYFKTRNISSANSWYQYQYIIQADNFAKEGLYSIQIDSKDRAGNHTSNASNKHSDSNLHIQFAVDQTAPSAVVTGTENGGFYEEESRTVMLDVQDNMALKDVTVFLNGNTYATYDAEQIAKLEDGLIPVKVEKSFTTQTIQLQATDMAGNVLSEDADGKYDKKFDDFNLVVNRSFLVQMLYTYWIPILAVITLIIGIIILLAVKHLFLCLQSHKNE